MVDPNPKAYRNILDDMDVHIPLWSILTGRSATVAPNISSSHSSMVDPNTIATGRVGKIQPFTFLYGRS